MPTRAQLESALRNADAAGDVSAAKQLANAIKSNAFEATTAKSSLMDDIGHAASVTGRDILTGVASLPLAAADLATGVVNVGRRAVGAEPWPSASENFQAGLDAAGLDNPQTAGQQLVSAATRGAVGAGSFAGAAAELAPAASGAARGVYESLAANPGLQSASGASAGASGELARQNNVGPLGQTIASVAGSLVPAAAITTAKTALQPRTYQTRIEPTLTEPAIQPSATDGAAQPVAQQIESLSQQATQKLGLDWAKVDQSVRDQIKVAIKNALDNKVDLPPEAVARDAIYKSQGLQTTRALVTRNFEDALKEQNLMTTPEGGPLRAVYDANNAVIRNKLRDLAPAQISPSDLPTFGQSIRSDLEGGANRSAKIRNDFYATAREKEGGNVADLSDLFGFMGRNRSRLATSTADAPVISYLKDAGILTKKGVADIAKGRSVRLSRYPTLNELTDLRGVVNNAAASTQDKNTQSLLGSMRAILDDAEAAAGGEAFKNARSVFGAQKSVWEGNPLLVNLLKNKRGFRGVDTIPDEEVFNKAIINSTNDDFSSVWDRLGSKQKDLSRAQLGKYIEDKVFSNMGTNESGDVVASAPKLVRALEGINPKKLEIIYGPKKAGDLQLLAKSLREISSPPRGTVPQGSAPKIEMLTRTLLGALKVGAKLPSVIGNTVGGVANVIKSGAESKQNIQDIEQALSPIPEISKQLVPRTLQSVSPGAAPLVTPLERLQAQ